jgi:hypothetical protein
MYVGESESSYCCRSGVEKRCSRKGLGEEEAHVATAKVNIEYCNHDKAFITPVLTELANCVSYRTVFLTAKIVALSDSS